MVGDFMRSVPGHPFWHGLRSQNFCQEGARGQDSDIPELTKRKQIIVAGDDHIGTDGGGRCDDMIIIGIAAGWADIG
jgi:hypothetical protein